MAVVALLLAMAAPSGAHTHGKDSPSSGGVAFSSAINSWITSADDNVTDGHCVFVRYREGSQFGPWRNDGAKSCGPFVQAFHFPFPASAKLCVTGHWGSLNGSACRTL